MSVSMREEATIIRNRILGTVPIPIQNAFEDDPSLAICYGLAGMDGDTLQELFKREDAENCDRPDIWKIFCDFLTGVQLSQLTVENPVAYKILRMFRFPIGDDPAISIDIRKIQFVGKGMSIGASNSKIAGAAPSAGLTLSIDDVNTIEEEISAGKVQGAYCDTALLGIILGDKRQRKLYKEVWKRWVSDESLGKASGRLRLEETVQFLSALGYPLKTEALYDTSLCLSVLDVRAMAPDGAYADLWAQGKRCLLGKQDFDKELLPWM